MGRLKHKRGRPSKYRKSLQKNPYWEKVKRKVRIRDNFKCVLCSSHIRLETHHIQYYFQGESIVGRELEFLGLLATVCETCHDTIHKDKKHELHPKQK